MRTQTLESVYLGILPPNRMAITTEYFLCVVYSCVSVCLFNLPLLYPIRIYQCTFLSPFVDVVSAQIATERYNSTHTHSHYSRTYHSTHLQMRLLLLVVVVVMFLLLLFVFFFILICTRFVFFFFCVSNSSRLGNGEGGGGGKLCFTYVCTHPK